MQSALRSFLCSLLLLPLALAQQPEAASAPSAPLQVLIKPTPPFVMQDAAGEWTGISIELWRRIAAEQGWEFELRAVPDVPTLLEEMQKGEGAPDVAVAAVTKTADREESVDFSHGFFDSGLGIAVPAGRGGSVLSVLSRLLSVEFLGVLLVLVALLLGVGALLWFFERRRNREQFGGRPQHGLGHGFWWAAVTMTTVGYGDKAPITVPGRALALVWMFASILLISTFTAAIASSLTISQLSGDVRGPEDLPDVRVGVIRGTTGAQWCAARGIAPEELSELPAALAALRAGRLDAVLYDAPLLQYAIQQRHAGRLGVLPHRLQPSAYAFVLPEGSPLEEPIDQSLLRVLAGAEWREVVERYLGKD